MNVNELFRGVAVVIDDDMLNTSSKAPRDELRRILELEKINHAVVAFLDDGKIIEFKFSDFEIKEWDDIKDSRVGRLLPPYINRIQQRYSLYMQRQGLPRIPDDAIFPS